MVMQVLMEVNRALNAAMQGWLSLQLREVPKEVLVNQNNAYREQLTEAGLVLGGLSPDGRLVEMVELPKSKHPFFVACQFHPEFRSRPTLPHPLFAAYIGAAVDRIRTTA